MHCVYLYLFQRNIVNWYLFGVIIYAMFWHSQHLVYGIINQYDNISFHGRYEWNMCERGLPYLQRIIVIVHRNAHFSGFEAIHAHTVCKSFLVHGGHRQNTTSLECQMTARALLLYRTFTVWSLIHMSRFYHATCIVWFLSFNHVS